MVVGIRVKNETDLNAMPKITDFEAVVESNKISHGSDILKNENETWEELKIQNCQLEIKCYEIVQILTQLFEIIEIEVHWAVHYFRSRPVNKTYSIGSEYLPI